MPSTQKVVAGSTARKPCWRRCLRADRAADPGTRGWRTRVSKVATATPAVGSRRPDPLPQPDARRDDRPVALGGGVLPGRGPTHAEGVGGATGDEQVEGPQGGRGGWRVAHLGGVHREVGLGQALGHGLSHVPGVAVHGFVHDESPHGGPPLSSRSIRHPGRCRDPGSEVPS